MVEADLLAAMRAAPGDEAPIYVYADWLLSRGDPRGELIMLDQRERSGSPLTLAQLDRLLELASEHGFPKLPDDPCADIFPFAGGGSFPVQFTYAHEGHEYYLRWRYELSIEVDDITVFEGYVDTRTTNQWTFREINVILAIVSAAIRSGKSLADLVFPDQAGIEAHPRYHPGRSPFYALPIEHYEPQRLLELRDFPRWHRLWSQRQRMVGIEPPPRMREPPQCQCGVEGLTCYVAGCHLG